MTSNLEKAIAAKNGLLANLPKGMSVKDAHAIVGNLLDQAIESDQAKLKKVYCEDEFGLPQAPDIARIRADYIYYLGIISNPKHQYQAEQIAIATQSLSELVVFIRSM